MKKKLVNPAFVAEMVMDKIRNPREAREADVALKTQLRKETIEALLRKYPRTRRPSV